MTDYQLSSLREGWIFLLAPLLTGLVYFAASKASSRTRMLFAAHSAALISAYIYAVTVSPWTNRDNWQGYEWPFLVLLVAFISGGIYTLIRFDGHKGFHALQLLQAPSAFFVWFLGGMTISHDWL
jgi:hypothetical protein